MSVVVLTWNRAAILGDCLASILGQDYPSNRYELIVVDDGSTDGTPSVVRAFEQARVSVRYVRQDHAGVNVARNAGIRQASGDPICLTDDDIDAPRSWLSAMVAGAARHPEAGCIGGPYKLRLEGNVPRMCGLHHLRETQFDGGGEEREVDEVWGANLCVRRAAIDAIGLFDAALSGVGDEIEWQMRLRQSGGKVVYIPDAWLWHRRTARDLKLARLLRGRFRRQVTYPMFRRRMGLPLDVRAQLFSARRCLVHALRERCAGGLVDAVGYLGRVWGHWRARSQGR